MTALQALIVEDTPETAQLAQLTLKKLGIECVHALNGRQALAYLDTATPDIMLLDIGLPGMNGWEVLEAIKLDDDNQAFPIIVTTAAGDPVNRLIGKLQDRVKRYLIKPYDMDALEAAVHEILEV